MAAAVAVCLVTEKLRPLLPHVGSGGFRDRLPSSDTDCPFDIEARLDVRISLS